jgi:4-hydroxy-tetrahydrodipicolinate synthase
MLTPFDDKGRIDYTTLATFIRYYINAGATGLFANCLSSEMFELSEEERISLTAFVVKETAGKLPVFTTGTFGGSITTQAEFVKRIYDTGVTAVVAVTSLLADENEADDVLLTRIHELLRLTGNIPFGFYECPVPYKRLLPPAMLREIAATGRVIYYKDTSLDIAAVAEKIRLTASFPEFELYDAFMVNAIASLKTGCAGLSCIQGNYFPELISWLTINFDNPSYKLQTEKVQQFLVDTMDVIHNVYPLSAKYFLQSRNFPLQLATRRNTGILTPPVKASLDQLSVTYDNLRAELGLEDFAGSTKI